MTSARQQPAADPIGAITGAMAALRRRQRRSALAGPIPLADIHAAEVADVIATSHDTVTVGAIAEALSIDPSQASRRVKSAIERGLAQRVAVAHDGGRSALALTDDGQQLVRHLQQRRRQQTEHTLATWTPADRAVFAALLDRFLGDLDARPLEQPRDGVG